MNLPVNKYPGGPMDNLPLWVGKVSWTLNEDAIRFLDIPALDYVPLGEDDALLLTIRNGSAVVSLTCALGNMIKCLPALTTTPNAYTACTMVDAGDTVTCTAHGLNIGDAITFSGTTGGVTATSSVLGNTVPTVYYVIAVSDANTFQFSSTRGGAAFTITADGANSWVIADEFQLLTTISIPKYAAATTTAIMSGLESRIIAGFGRYGGRLIFMKSAAAAAAFTAYAEIRRA